jgi:CRP-like cAMP-binding protein
MIPTTTGLFPERRVGESPLNNMSRQTLSGDDWQKLFSSVPIQTYPQAAELFQQGGVARDVYLLENGLVKLIRLNRAGDELIVGLRFPGSLLGIAPVILCKPYPVTATTLTGCRLRRISAEPFLDLAKGNPEFSWHVQEVHCHEVYDQITQLVGLACLSAKHRLEQFLGQLIAVQCMHNLQGEIRMDLPLKHREIAQLIAVTPQHLSLLLRQMEDEGTIRREKGWVIVRNYKQLYQPGESQE